MADDLLTLYIGGRHDEFVRWCAAEKLDHEGQRPDALHIVGVTDEYALAGIHSPRLRVVYATEPDAPTRAAIDRLRTSWRPDAFEEVRLDGALCACPERDPFTGCPKPEHQAEPTGLPLPEFTTERYPSPDPAAMETLQQLANAGVIELRTVWCSEKGVLPATGHFCGTDANHEPDTFSVVHTPPVAERLLREQVPVTVHVPIREPDRG